MKNNSFVVELEMNSEYRRYPSAGHLLDETAFIHDMMFVMFNKIGLATVFMFLGWNGFVFQERSWLFRLSDDLIHDYDYTSLLHCLELLPLDPLPTRRSYLFNTHCDQIMKKFCQKISSI